jgi:hypothetical protein
MAFYSRFGKAFGELGGHLKASRVVPAWKEGGLLAAAKVPLVDYFEPYIRGTAEDVLTGKVATRMDVAKLAGRRLGTEFAVAGGGAAVGGLGYAGWKKHEDAPLNRGALMTSMLVGGKLGFMAGGARTFAKYSSADNFYRHLGRAPGVFWRGLRG